MAVGHTGAGSIFYDIYLRLAASYTAPTSLSEITTLLGTGSQAGMIEKDSLVVKVEPNDTVEAQGGGAVQEVVRDYAGTLEMKDINATEANVEDVWDTYRDKDIDIILHDPSSERLQVIKDVPAIITEETGSNASLSMRCKKIVVDPDDFRDRLSFADFV